MAAAEFLYEKLLIVTMSDTRVISDFIVVQVEQKQAKDCQR